MGETMRKNTDVLKSAVMIKPMRKNSRHGRKVPYDTRGTWFRLGQLGLFGCSVVLPMVFGAVIGIWLDDHYPGSHSWTLVLLLVGLTIGCLNAWYWMAKKVKEMGVF
jgi:ATP synthase protein I